MGIRITANRASAAILPVVMGAIAEVFGIGNSFLIIGLPMLVSLAGVAFYCQRVLSRAK